MPQYPVKVRLDFGEGWNNLNNDQRSLINFFMKDAALYITPLITREWEWDGHDYTWVYHYDYSQIFGCIQSRTRCFFDIESKSTPYNLTIPYFNFLSEDNITFSLYGFPENEPLQLVNASNYLTYLSPDEYNGAIDLHVVDTPITINTIINNQENVDSSLLPFIPNVTEKALVIPLSGVSNLEYRFQYRTSNFGIATVSGITHKVYYKVGICPTCQANIAQEIISDFEICSVCIGVFGICSIGRTAISIIPAPDSYSYSSLYPAFSFNDSGLESLSDNYYEIDLVPNRAIIPFECSTTRQKPYPDLVLFLELYDATTGLPANLDLHEDPIAALQVSSSLNGSYYDVVVESDCVRYGCNSVNLVITKDHLNDNVFIETPSLQLFPSVRVFTDCYIPLTDSNEISSDPIKSGSNSIPISYNDDYTYVFENIYYDNDLSFQLLGHSYDGYRQPMLGAKNLSDSANDFSNVTIWMYRSNSDNISQLIAEERSSGDRFRLLKYVDSNNNNYYFDNDYAGDNGSPWFDQSKFDELYIL